MDSLVLSSGPTELREALLRAIFDCHASVAIAHPGSAFPELCRFTSVVLDGSQAGLSAGHVEQLWRFVEQGGKLLAFGAAPSDQNSRLAELLGCFAAPVHPQGEVFVKLVDGHRLTRRLDREFSVVDSFTPLQSCNGYASPLAVVTWSLKDQPAVFMRPLGEGLIVVSGLGNTVQAHEVASLRTLFRRVLRPAGASAERPLGVGVVGYGVHGGMGLAHGTAVQHTDGLRFVATCDSSQTRLETARQEFPGLRTYATPEELAADPDIDLVVVATPPTVHTRICLDMLRAGKHVVCEKPLCFTVDEADDLIATAKSHDVVLTVHQNRRWDTDFLAVRRAVDKGLLGDLFNMETFVGAFEHPCRFWHSDADASGGAVYDWGSHHVDWILQLMPGLPSRVSAHAHKRVWHDVTNHDQVRVRLLWEDGREAEFFQSNLAAIARPKFYLQGSQGTLVGHYRPIVVERVERGRGYVKEAAHFAEAPADLVLAHYESGYGIVEQRLPLAPENRFAFFRNLADHLYSGEELAVTPESVREVVAVLQAAGHSISSGGAPIGVEAAPWT